MATLERKEEISYILTLTEDEAFWLKSILSNITISAEDNSDYYHRCIMEVLNKLK